MVRPLSDSPNFFNGLQFMDGLIGKKRERKRKKRERKGERKGVRLGKKEKGSG
jgi:hypothetical protein